MTRDASTIGAGLAPARDPRPIRAGERIHVIGVAGAGASAAALLGAAAGAEVSGCDPGGPSQYTDALVERGLTVDWQHDARHVTDGPAPDRLAVTKALTAVTPNHPELVAARLRAIPAEPWQQVVADAAVGRTLVAVAGTHGKSTTCGWLVHVLAAAGVDPSAFVGALLPAVDAGGMSATARAGAGDLFVVEADEYAGNFDPYRPEVVVLTTIEWDHPDVFADRAAVVDAFEGWIRRAVAAGKAPVVVADVADPGTRELLERLPDLRLEIVPYLLAGEALTSVGPEAEARGLPPTAVRPLIGRIVGADADGTSVDVTLPDGRGGSVRLGSAGRHNVADALAVLAATLRLGIGLEPALGGLASFGGVRRRLERKGEARGVVVYDDYGHHPTAIRATLAALRQREPGRRVWAVYEPLTYHRTAALLDDFAEVLVEADAVVIADIWAGRDPDTSVASAAGLAAAVGRRAGDRPVAAPGSVEMTAAWLAERVEPGDAVLVMGGGRSYRIAELLLEALAR